MKETKNLALDYIRVIALLGVVTDHCIQRFDYPFPVSGLWMGGVNVTIFFALSAYLFGERWRQQQMASFKAIPFLKKRVTRIYIPLWIVVLAIVPIEYYCYHQFDIETIVYNLLGLGWAKPFGAGGHLWYITMMMVLYMAFILFSRMRLDKYPLWGWLLVLCGIILLYSVFPQYFMTYSHAGPLMFLWGAGLFFYKGEEVLSLVSRHKFVALTISTALAVSSWLLYVLVPNWHDAYKPWATITTCLVGFMAFVVLMSIINPHKENAAIKHLAGVSYEYYLLHLPLLPVVALMVPNKWLSLAVLLVMAWFLSLLLQYASNMIIQMTNKKG